MIIQKLLYILLLFLLMDKEGYFATKDMKQVSGAWTSQAQV